MCPSYMATGDEDKTTRARANVIREFLNKEKIHGTIRKFMIFLISVLAAKDANLNVLQVLILQRSNRSFFSTGTTSMEYPLRTRLIAYISVINQIGSFAPAVYNFILKNRITSGILKKITGFASERSIPLLYKTTLRKWIRKNLSKINPENPKGTVCLFIDEFTDYNDTETGIDAIKLLTSLNYKVVTTDHKVSARTFLSKGLVRTAQKNNQEEYQGIIRYYK